MVEHKTNQNRGKRKSRICECSSPLSHCGRTGVWNVVGTWVNTTPDSFVENRVLQRVPPPTIDDEAAILLARRKHITERHARLVEMSFDRPVSGWINNHLPCCANNISRKCVYRWTMTFAWMWLSLPVEGLAAHAPVNYWSSSYFFFQRVV